MRVLAIAQNKGGVGKTTVARLLSEYFARQGKRGLGIDLDPQCNYSQRFVVMASDPSDPDGIYPPVHPDHDPKKDENWDGTSSTADIYSGHMVVPYPTWISGLEMIPGHGERLREQETRPKEISQMMLRQLKDFLWNPALAEHYDVVIIDTAPSKNALTASALHAASHLLIPTLPEPQSIEGLMGMLAFWRRENRSRLEPLKIVGILPNRVKKVSLHESYMGLLMERVGPNHFLAPCYLGDRIAFSESDHPGAKPQSVFDLPPSNKARQEAEQMGSFVAESLFA